MPSTNAFPSSQGRRGERSTQGEGKSQRLGDLGPEFPNLEYEKGHVNCRSERGNHRV
jgi:hypothetical protein